MTSRTEIAGGINSIIDPVQVDEGPTGDLARTAIERARVALAAINAFNAATAAIHAATDLDAAAGRRPAAWWALR